ncbi:hypothetical protein CC79DRAFT_201910 [Sarocladium strictum]
MDSPLIMTRHPNHWSHPRPVTGYVGGAWPVSHHLPSSPSELYSYTHNFTRPRSSRSEISYGVRPRKSRRIHYQQYEETPPHHRSHDATLSRGASSLKGASPPRSFQPGPADSSRHVHASADRRPRAQPNVGASPRRTATSRHPQTRAITTQAGSWCEEFPQRYQMLPDECLFDDDDPEFDPAWDVPPRCPSPPGYRLATPDLAPLCTDTEFCTCCNHDSIGPVAWHGRRREKLEAQGKYGAHALAVSLLIPYSSRCDDLYRRCQESRPATLRFLVFWAVLGRSGVLGV